MAALSSVCRARGQWSRRGGRRRPALPGFALGLALCLTLSGALLGCGPSPDEVVAGRWVIDVDAWLAELPAELPIAPAASAQAQARAMAAQTAFVFAPGRCQRIIAGRVDDHPCRFERDDRGTVVLRAQAPDGSVHFVRAHPRRGGLELTWQGERLPLRRTVAGASGGAP